MTNFVIRLLLLVLLTFGKSAPLWADDAEKFKIKGKPVPDIVATVNGMNITGEFLKNKVEAWGMSARQQGKEVTPDLEEKFARNTVTQTIEQELFYQKGKELNIEIGTEVIQREVDNIQTKFSDYKMFLATLAFQHLSLEMLAKKIEKQLIEDEVVRREIAPHVDVPDSEVEAYYNKHKDSFIEPKKYRVSQVFTAKVDIRDRSKAEDPERQKKAERMIKIINSEARDKIEMILQKLKDGVDFVELVKQFSEDEISQPRGGDIGEIYPHQTLPAFAAVISKLKVGETSEIVEYEDGFHIFKLTNIKPEKLIPLKNMKTDILNSLLRIEVEKKKREYVSELKKNVDIKIFF